VSNHRPSPLARWGRTAGTMLLVLGTQSCFGSGFFLIEQSVTAMGTAYAGSGALGEDATTIFFNPAGLGRIQAPELVLGAHLVSPTARFENQGSRHLVRPFRRGLGRDEGSEAGKSGVVPHIDYAHPLNHTITLGLGVSVPFGMVTDYGRDNWIGRYHALRSGLETVNVNPSVSWRLSDHLTLGAGISYAYLKADISNMLDVGGIIPLVGPLFATRLDSKLTVKGEDGGWGYNVGALFEPSERTRIGLHFRSHIDIKLQGDAEIVPPGGPLVAGTIGRPLGEIGAQSRTELPAMAAVSAVHQLGDRWNVMADVTWVDWSKIKQLAFNFDGPLPDGIEKLDWKDALRYAVGVDYRPNSRWTWRGGLALDTTPIPNSASRTPRLPDEDRLWVTVGVGYQPSPRLKWDFGYAHLFVKTPEINRVDSLGVARINGKYDDASVDVLSAQLTWRFH